MRILTWNVNGIRALVQYHPYCDDLHKNYKEIWDYLNADVLCFQETKITRSKLGTDIALVPTYESYWSFHKRKSGYSGVAVYVKDHHRLVAVEQGISGIFCDQMALPPTPPISSLGKESSTVAPPGTPFELRPVVEKASASIPTSNTPVNPNARPIGGYVTHYEPSVLQELDSEGRALVLDFGMFVLFNLYCPNETDETRLPFKIAFYTVLEERVRALIAEGRQVIIVGDMNVVPSELDHCDPERWKKETGVAEFTNTEPRKWFNRFLSTGGGPMVDLYRVFHPDEKGAFTCWNTLINARPSNYGTRLDFVLVTEGLLPWLKSCDRLPQIVGSDHCPVVCELFDQIEVPDEEGAEQDEHVLADEKESRTRPMKTLRLKDILASYNGVKDHPLAARMYDEFAGKQQNLFKFFKAPTSATAPTTTHVSPTTTEPVGSGQEGPEHTEKRGAESSLSAMGDDLGKRRRLSSSVPSSTPSQPSTQGLEASSGNVLSKAQPPSQASMDIPTSNGGLSSHPSAPSPSAASAPSMAVATALVNSAKPARPPGTSSSSGGWPPKKASTRASTAAATPMSKNNMNGGQMMLSSFFKKPSNQAPPKDPTNARPSTPEPQQQQEEEEESSPSPMSQDTSPSSSQVESEFYRDLLNTCASSLAGSSYTVNTEETTSKWANLFTKKDVPNCSIHNQPCIEFRVNKKGPNKGRLFYLCSKPIGPEGTLVGTNPDYRCDFFQWKNPPSNAAKPGQIPFVKKPPSAP
ncbi:Class II abasic (AP) endonuclease [Actinomortierella ambigua]|nr:Class II abasic (AP) endonuclease [Actinomortierella ambigua]